jgi:hypothetical protein
MDNIKKYSAGGIVIDPRTEKIVLTKKLAKKEYVAMIRKLLYNIIKRTPEETIKKFKLWAFTKGKIERWWTIQQTALQEIEEESWIKEKDIVLQKHLWSFLKQKQYGFKKVEMFLYVLTKEYLELNPTDKRHIAAFIDLHKAEEYMQNEEEKKFFLKVKDEILQTLLAHKDRDILSIKKQKNVPQVDIGVKR